ncbi:MAG: cytochrome c oxidase subunit II [Robiginitomaculum sp.]
MRMSRLIKLLGGLSAAALLGGIAHAAGLPTDGNIGLQEAASANMEMVTKLHNTVFAVIFAIFVFVVVLMLYIMVRFREKANPVPSKTSHNTMLEVIWTAAPVMVVLFFLAIATRPLYTLDVIPEADMTIKVVGNQWNWDYSYPDHGDFEFNSMPMSEEDAKAAGKPVLFAATDPLVVPAGKTIRVIVTASDVLHAFAVPAFAVKIDAVPGRLNETWFKVDKPGTYYGQCSEICGQLHYNMPIEVKVVTPAQFDAWVLTRNPEFVKTQSSTTIEARNTEN